MSLLRKALVLLAILFTSLFLAEVGVRSFYDRPPLPPEELLTNPLASLSEFDPDLKTRYRANISTMVKSPAREFEVLYQINEIRLRDYAMQMPGRKPVLVLALGDGYTEGWGVSFEDSALKRAEKALVAKPGIDPRLRIINGGVSGYGAAQSYLLGIRLIDSLQPNVVVFLYTSVMPSADQDYLAAATQDTNGLVTGLSPAGQQALSAPLQPSASPVAGLLTRVAKYSVLARLLAQRWQLAAARQRIKPGDPATDLFAGARAEQSRLVALHEPSLRHVAAIAAKAKAANIPFVLVHVPLPLQVGTREWARGRARYNVEDRVYPSDDVGVVQAFCTQQSLQCVTAHEVIRKESAKAGPLLYHREDFHLTTDGNKVLGNWMAEQLAPLVTH